MGMVREELYALFLAWLLSLIFGWSFIIGSSTDSESSMLGKKCDVLGRGAALSFWVCFAIWLMEVHDHALEVYRDEGPEFLLIYSISHALDAFKFVLNTSGLGYEHFPYDSPLQYRHTDEVWGCGSSKLQEHAVGGFSGLFFPHFSLNRLNQCCMMHDLYYCCQTDIKAADDELYTCVQEQCDLSYNYVATSATGAAADDAANYISLHSSASTLGGSGPITLTPRKHMINGILCETGLGIFKLFLNALGQVAYRRAAVDPECAREPCHTVRI